MRRTRIKLKYTVDDEEFEYTNVADLLEDFRLHNLNDSNRSRVSRRKMFEGVLALLVREKHTTRKRPL